MKKQLFAIASVVVLAAAVTFTSCKKDDVTAPVITVTGGNSQTQNLPATAGAGTWTDPTATATDDEDGDVTVSVSGTVDPNTAGTYTLTYTATDAAGNTATETVTVMIVNAAAYLQGSYNGVDTCQISGAYTYTATVNVSNTVNNTYTINNFAAFGTGVNVTGTVSGTNMSFGAQPVGSMGNILSGSGVVLSSTGTVAFNVDFTWTDGSNTESCDSDYTHQ